ncbi:MAG: OprD family outer membrane porin [Robiginitalea sp.]
MIRGLFLSLTFLLVPLLSSSQESGENLRKGHLSGQWRNYYMSTINNGALTDFTALATGGYLKYTFRVSERLTLGAALYNTTHLGGMDLTHPDPSTGRISRYEAGLFDGLDLANDAVFLLGEAYISYHLPEHRFKLGRMKINSPLINPQDGRMIPTLVQGFWYEFQPEKTFKFQLGLLNEIAPRSTGEFFGIGESIGTYPEGRSPEGTPNGYPGNTVSDFILMVNTAVKITDALQIHLWDYLVENVSNSLYINPRFTLSPSLQLDGEWLHQDRVGEGGNPLDSLRYFYQRNADILGVRLTYKKNRSRISLAYERILPNGQFLSPREWGREGLFSFQKRERSEGTADNHALVIYYHTRFPVKRDLFEIQSVFSLGRHWKPSVLDAAANKYAIPDYTHLNLDFFFHLEKLKALKPELLLTAKFANGDVPDNPNFYFNKVDMFHLSFVLNYNF